MIAYLSGTPVHQHNTLIILVQGVGYGVQVGTRTLQKTVGKERVDLFIHTHVREDEIALFGFGDAQTLELFTKLIDVSGVGPKTALAISDFGSEEIVRAVQQADVAFFSSMPRVGKKLAQKIIIELKSKLGSLKDLDLAPESQQHSDVSEALRSLGFSEHDIQKALQNVEVEQFTLEQAITQSIKVIGGR